MTTVKPTMFIGSSVEGLGLAQAVQSELQHDLTVTLWSQGIFQVNKYTLETLLEVTEKFDFGLFVFSPSDVAKIRSSRKKIVRDNVLFESGLFFGSLGRNRSFLIVPSGVKDFHIPTDLLGLTSAEYSPGSHEGNLQGEVAAACNQIRNAVRKVMGYNDPWGSLTGDWNQVWHYEGSTFPPRNESKAVVKQIGSHFVASFEGKPNGHKDPIVFDMKGTIDRNQYITGIWGNPNNGPTHFGSFQLYLHPGARKMNGQYVGFRSDNSIYCNNWDWER